MKELMAALVLGASAHAALAADVGVSISIGQPGFYGHIDIGDYYPRPRLIYPQPVVIVPGTVRAPVYMHVPPGHAKNWRKHCGRYDACGRPVYFVEDHWYNDVYVPHYRERHGSHAVRYDDRDDRRGGRGGYRDDRDDRGDDHDRHERGGRGHGNGKGHGHGRD